VHDPVATAPGSVSGCNLAAPRKLIYGPISIGAAWCDFVVRFFIFGNAEQTIHEPTRIKNETC
jgi:hypothetical protein